MLTFEGYSDDVVVIGGDTKDEIGAYDEEASVLVGTETEGLVVRFFYAPNRLPKDGPGNGGTWQARIDMLDEDVSIPWPVHVDNGESGYSPRVVVMCPAGTPWRRIGSDEEGGRHG